MNAISPAGVRDAKLARRRWRCLQVAPVMVLMYVVASTAKDGSDQQIVLYAIAVVLTLVTLGLAIHWIDGEFD